MHEAKQAVERQFGTMETLRAQLEAVQSRYRAAEVAWEQQQSKAREAIRTFERDLLYDQAAKEEHYDRTMQRLNQSKVRQDLSKAQVNTQSGATYKTRLCGAHGHGNTVQAEVKALNQSLQTAQRDYFQALKTRHERESDYNMRRGVIVSFATIAGFFTVITNLFTRNYHIDRVRNHLVPPLADQGLLTRP